MIQFELELASIITDIKNASSYLDCEKVLNLHLKKLSDNGNSNAEIERYLNKVLPHLRTLHKAVSREEGVNYQYAAEYVQTLVTTSYWHSWISRIK